MKLSLLISALFAVALLCALPAAALTTVQAVPSSVTLGAGETTTVDLVIDTLPDGLSGGKLTVSLTDGTVADITAVSYPDWASLHANGDLPADETYVKVADMTKQVEAGAKDVVFATLTLTGVANGTTSVDVVIEKLDDDDGYPVNPTPTAVPTQVPTSSGGNDDDYRPTHVSTRSPTVTATATRVIVDPTAAVSTSEPTVTAIPVPTSSGDDVTVCPTCSIPATPIPTQSPVGALLPILALWGAATFCTGKR